MNLEKINERLERAERERAVITDYIMELRMKRQEIIKKKKLVGKGTIKWVVRE